MWLDFESTIIARLQAKLDASITVLAARSLAGVKEVMQTAPAVQVYGGEYTPAQVSDTGATAIIEQAWTCVVVVSNPKDQTGGSSARSDAGPICDAVLSALLGWPATDPANTRLRLVRAPAPLWSAGGYGYYPLAFTRRMTVTGDPT